MNSWVPLDGTTLVMIGKIVIHTSAAKVKYFPNCDPNAGEGTYAPQHNINC